MGGSGEVGVLGASSTASELVTIASQVLDHAASRLCRSALAHAAGEVIRTQGDATLLRAIELAPDLKVARAIRDAAETACAAISISSNGAERHARLFSIGLVIRFGELLTTRELGDRLTPILQTGSLLTRVLECGTRHHARSFVWPHVWTFDDLSRLPLREVRQRTIMASTASAISNGGMIAPFALSLPPQRRSATFLRYLVGCQIGTDGISEHNDNRVRLGDCVQSVVRASLPDAQDVAVLYTGHFHGPLWDGLRAYQAYRLADLVAAMAARGIPVRDLAASISLSGTRSEMAAQIAFFRGGKKADHHVYHILLEPLADPTTTVARIVAPLRKLGVDVHIMQRSTAPCIGNRRGLGRNSRAAHRSATFRLALPL